MVIVEYCKYGNLSNFLRAKREFFLPYRVTETFFVVQLAVTVILICLSSFPFLSLV